ncbi:MAG: (2Fe-2S)-binding protein [Planctomycetes bacterium]|nr:(2Fe-2S)-binding protein [Planctomycetota bacterium]
MKKKDRRRGVASKEPSGFSRRSFIQTLGLAGVTATIPLTQGCGTSETGPEVPAEGLGPAPVEISLNVNEQEVKLKVEPRVTLLDALRDHLKLGSADPVDLTGSKRVCDRGSCGACTMIVDGRTVYSCTTLAVEAQGRKIRTVEGLGKDGKLHPLQEEFVECDGLMCGFCTPGFLVSGVSCLEKHPNATRDDIKRALDGNICRCGTQSRALEACEKAARRMKGRR